MGVLQSFTAIALATIWITSLALASVFLVKPSLLSGKPFLSDRVRLPNGRAKGALTLFAASCAALILLAVIVPQDNSKSPAPPPAADTRKVDLLDTLFKVSHELTQCTQSYGEIMAVLKRSEVGHASALDVYSKVQRGIKACDYARLGLLNVSVPESIEGADKDALTAVLRYDCPAALDQAASALKRYSEILNGGAGQLAEAYNMKQEISDAAGHRIACVAPFVSQAKARGASESDLKRALGE